MDEQEQLAALKAWWRERGGLVVLVITAAHSRFMLGRMIPTRKTEDLLLGTWELVKQLGRVPRRLIWDNEPGIGHLDSLLTTGDALFAADITSTGNVFIAPAGAIYRIVRA